MVGGPPFLTAKKEHRVCVHEGFWQSVPAESVERVLLVKPSIGIAIPVLNAYNQAADDTHAGTVSKKLLVSTLGIILLRLQKLMAKVEISP